MFKPLGLSSPSGNTISQSNAGQQTISSISSLPPGAQIISTGQQLQQDPNDPHKWQVITTTTNSSSPQHVQQVPAPSNQVTVTSESLIEGSQKTRVRRVACTCPNCSDGER